MWNSTVTRYTDFASPAKGNNMPKVHLCDLSWRQEMPIGIVNASLERFPMRLPQLLCSSIFAIVLTAAEVHAEDWTQFLGAHRNGISSEKNLISEWPSDGPKIIWRTSLGISMSSVVVRCHALIRLRCNASITMTDIRQQCFCISQRTTNTGR